MTYFSLLPSDLIFLLGYYLPVDIIDSYCDKLIKLSILCNNENFWRTYTQHHRPEYFSSISNINLRFNLPFKLLYNAPRFLLSDLITTEKLSIRLFITDDYLPLFIYYLNRTEIITSNLLYEYTKLAISRRSYDIAMYLVTTYDDALNADQKYTILQEAIKEGNMKMVKYLVEDLDYKNNPDFRYILTYASNLGNYQVVKYLLDSFKFRQHDKNIALSYSKHEDIIGLLRTHGAI